MDSYIVRIYRREKKKPRVIVGTVERPEIDGKMAFSSLDELWEILSHDGRTKLQRADKAPIYRRGLKG